MKKPEDHFEKLENWIDDILRTMYIERQRIKQGKEATEKEDRESVRNSSDGDNEHEKRSGMEDGKAE